MENLYENVINLDTTSTLVEGFEPQGEKEKHYYIRGKFATIEAVNNNKRFYPRALWEREVAKYQEEIKNGTKNTLMEWDHPKDRLDVDPIEAIGKITKLWIEGNFVMGEAVIFDTPKAETLKSMIKHGVQISVSSRARGRVDASGVVQDFNLITFDFVATPSDRSATMYGIFENHQEENDKFLKEYYGRLNETKNGHNMETNDIILENLVSQVRTKDVIIDDLNEELQFLRDQIVELKESKDEEISEANSTNTIIYDNEEMTIPSEYTFLSFFADGVYAWKGQPRFVDGDDGFEFKGPGGINIGYVELNGDFISKELKSKQYEGVPKGKAEDDILWRYSTLCTLKIRDGLDITPFVKKTKIIDFIELNTDTFLNESNRPRRFRNSLTEREQDMRNRLSEGQIGHYTLDLQHRDYKDFITNRDEEDSDFSYRRIGEPLTQTHRHQDHSLLRDTDPASSTYSGEAEVLKIARLLQQTFGRDNVVGSVLGRDLDTGAPGTVRGVAADIEDEVRYAENGLDHIQKALSFKVGY